MGSKATTKTRKHEKEQFVLRAFVASWLHFAIGTFLMMGVSVALSAAPRKPMAPPKVVNFVRQTLKRGAAAAYAELETAIARGYRQGRIPMYWVCLQAAS